MKSVLYILSALAVVALAIWAYRENYRTQQALVEASRLQGEIGAMHETLARLNAEWAYLNRPDRLRDLTSLGFERLGLLPLRPEQFGQIEQVAYPDPEFPQHDPKAEELQ
ncbi:hypothetical protein C8N32_11921 [Rhodovulum imhoffii]|uniref:Cell division protein FtsL n=1 Tax=Rhodovulum imhoffii TaxID=365340 RepID=A0A2T5BPJ7_9RHOB|nr:cell division protein FtsL [Rhodovulum imhoffii]MBK5932880.1 cell division protein FtsL [Rhodovulum imhoffii]PTN00964.1 hypothetical protein C8N32_11921 [Rhodovulum imhoffii]